MDISMSTFYCYPLNFLRPRKRINFKKLFGIFFNFMLTSSTSGAMAAILVGRQWEHDVHSTSKINVNQRLEITSTRRYVYLLHLRYRSNVLYTLDLCYNQNIPYQYGIKFPTS